MRIFEEMTGRPVQVEHVPEQALEAQRDAATNPMDRTFAALMLATARGDAIDMRRTLADFPVRLTSVRDYARRLMAAGAAGAGATHGAG